MSYNNVKYFLRNCEKPENYNFEFEFDVKNYDEKMPILDRYFVYQAWHNKDLMKQILGEKKIDVDQYKKQSDPDSSDGKCKLTADVYEKLWDWKTNDEEVVGTSFGKIDEFGIFGGDTMNSVQRTMGYCIRKIKEESEHRQNYRDKTANGWGIGTCLQLYCTFPERFKSDLKELKSYIDAYHTIGNFVLVPAYFNQYRGFNSYIGDYWDRSLWLLKNKEDDLNKPWKTRWGNVLWEKKDYNKYINTFFLWDYVDSEYNPQNISPSGFSANTSEIKKFLEIIPKLIKRRGCFMVAMLQLWHELGERRYLDLKNQIFNEERAIYESYAIVFKRIREVLSEDEFSKVANILSCAKNKIFFEYPIEWDKFISK